MSEKDIMKLVRPMVQDIAPYRSARDEFEDFQAQKVFLDANENPYKSIANRYPDPLQRELKRALAKVKGVNPDQILLGNGSDEVLDLIFRTFCEPGKDEVILLPPHMECMPFWRSSTTLRRLQFLLTKILNWIPKPYWMQ